LSADEYAAVVPAVPSSVALVGAEDGWARRRRRIRDELQAIALTQFARTSIDEVTVDEIAEAAGMSVRTFFRYFATKEEVVLAGPSRFVDSVCTALLQRPTDETLLEAVHAAIRECDYWEQSDPSISLLLRDALAANPGLEQRILGNPALLERFRRAVAERLDIPETDLSIQVYAQAINGVIAVALGQWATLDTVDDFVALVGEAFELLSGLS
jgi:AcrR family transcriptional regulator